MRHSLLESYLVDTASSSAHELIAHQLADRGLVTLTGLTSRTAMLAFASRIMSVVPHRDSESDGLTTIRRTTRFAGRPGFAGFGTDELVAHTERSGTVNPPRLMLLVCARPADTDGECVLADGQLVHSRIREEEPDALQALSQLRSAYFGNGDGHASQVFTPHADGTVALRLRQDSLARFSPLVQPYLPRLRTAIAAEQIRLPLLSGQGYLLDNWRWLHARAAFCGDRVCWRALGEPRFPLPRGFTPLPIRAGHLLPH